MAHKSMNRFKRMGSPFLLELSHPLVFPEAVEQLKVTDVGMAGDTGFLCGFLEIGTVGDKSLVAGHGRTFQVLSLIHI